MKLKNIIFGVMCFQRGVCDLSFLKGKWGSTVKSENSSYFHVKDSSIYAIREDSKVSMDIKKFEKNGSLLKLEMNNFKVHSAPLFLNVFDYRVIRFVRNLMKYGISLEFATLPNSSLVVNWKVHANDKENVIQEGKLYLSKFHHMSEEC